MKTYRPAFARWVAFQLSTIFWVTFVALPAVGAYVLGAHIDRRFFGHGLQDLLAMCVGFTALVVLGGVWVSIDQSLHYAAARYRIGAADLTVTTGGIFRTTEVVSLLEVQRIEMKTGPLMRRFGIADLVIYRGSVSTVRLDGLRDAAAVRDLLVRRHDELRETSVDERVERRLP